MNYGWDLANCKGEKEDEARALGQNELDSLSFQVSSEDAHASHANLSGRLMRVSRDGLGDLQKACQCLRHVLMQSSHHITIYCVVAFPLQLLLNILLLAGVL